ncbi:CDP-diacylglycerol-phosphatidylglycerol phosphatidyltransferase [Rarobacter incanus]|uniref:CDP-diacylglycerol-phosphatidylglycerol phosphatidyltransferase n=1 Tax=Rarobacter incanus TaxID=153494 RepID=A0A542SM09_9MICO|nr:CDP-diacylglycerol-phosphatidylglycerol phosphatidyltransferase [Rarobacter incanus]
MAQSPKPTNRIVTIPNVISTIRLVLVAMFGVLVASSHEVAAIVVLGIAGFSDWLDGFLARRLNQVSRLGQMLDPIADRVLIIASLLALAYRDVVPWWIVALVFGREILLAALLAAARPRGYQTYEVSKHGKLGAFLLMVAFPLLLLAMVVGPAHEAIKAIGWAFMIWGVVVYWLAGIDYAAAALRVLRRPALAPSTEG